MHIRKFNFLNNSLILYSNNLFQINSVELNDNLKSCSPDSIHNILLNVFPNGWFALLIIGENQFLLNDFISSNRIYFNPVLNKWSQIFWDLDASNINDKIINEIAVRGYTTGDQTISDNIYKLLPCSILDLRTFRQTINHKQLFNIPQNNSFDFSKYINLACIKSRKVGVAFSGGLDSTFIAYELIRNDIIPTLYYIDNEMDEDRNISLEQAKNISNKLNLSLQIISISKREIEIGLHRYAHDYPNDLSVGFVTIKLLLDKVQNFSDILLTGQNSDTFLTYGLSRSYHFVETLTRVLYSTSFKKIFNNNALNLFDKILLRFVYKLRGFDRNSIPRNKIELLNGFANEKYYLPIFSEFSIFNSKIEYYEGLNYYNSIVLNKLLNHIAGNHSLVWSNSENPIVFMPFGHIDFMRFSITRYGKFFHILNPKSILQNKLNFKFKRINNNMLVRLSKYFFSSKHNAVKTNFNISGILYKLKND